VPPHPSASSDELSKLCFVKEFVDSAFSNEFCTEERFKDKLREEEQQNLSSLNVGNIHDTGEGSNLHAEQLEFFLLH
jgi:hypothetical protein